VNFVFFVVKGFRVFGSANGEPGTPHQALRTQHSSL
jgi:hypothetical protein